MRVNATPIEPSPYYGEWRVAEVLSGLEKVSVEDIDFTRDTYLAIHILTSTGIVVIENYYTRKVVTKLIARPQQIQRYYAIIGEKAPEWLLMVAKRHCELGYNNI